MALAGGQGISADSVGQLTGQASVVLGCGAGLLACDFTFLGDPFNPQSASYSLAVTPIGGFTGRCRSLASEREGSRLCLQLEVLA